MSTAAGAVSLERLKRRALSLGAVNAFDHAMQFLLPVVLVRCLDPQLFGEYRLLWLAVGTVMAIATLNMSGTLYFFVPRSEPRRKRLYIYHTLLYLAVSGALFAFLVSPWNPLLPGAMRALEPYGAIVPLFVGLWVLASLIDHLPTVDEAIAWQARVTLSVSALRVLLVGGGAWLTGDLRVVLWLLLAMVLFKAGLLLYYVRRRHGLGPPWFARGAFSEQLRHSAPLGLTNALYSFRGYADQWVAASLFALSSFAAFSIAALVGQVMHIVRHSVLEAFLPSMSRLHAGGDLRAMLDMNGRGNVIVARLLYPVLAFTFVFARELVTLVYTAAYVEAVPAIRAYVIGMLPMAIETGSLVLLLRRGNYAVGVTAFALFVSVALSWWAARGFGLAGAAAGSVVAVYIDRVLMLRHVARHTGIALGKLQDWPALAAAASFAAAIAALAWVLVERILPDQGPAARLAAGAGLFAVAYASIYFRHRPFNRRSKDAI